MASGDRVVHIEEVWPTQTLFAPLMRRASATTPAAGINVWNFVSTSITYLDFLCYLQGYEGGGLTFTLRWTSATATTGTTRWSVAIRRWGSAVNVFAAHTYDYNIADGTAPGTSGFPVSTTLTFTNGADMDSWAVNETAIVRVRRDTSVGGNMTGGAQLITLVGKET